MHILRLAGTVLRSLGRPPATRLYPFVVRPAIARSRGHIDIDIDGCIYCGMCDRRCPTQAITVVKADRTWAIERLRCIQCNSCVELCPTKCLGMGTAYTDPSFGSVRDQFTSQPKPAQPVPPAKPTVQPLPAGETNARVPGDA